MLAYYVEWRLRRAWAPILFDDHDRAAAEAARASPVAAAEPSPASVRKRGRRRTDDDLPVSSLRDLLRHLATLTLNTVAPRSSRRETPARHPNPFSRSTPPAERAISRATSPAKRVRSMTRSGY